MQNCNLSNGWWRIREWRRKISLLGRDRRCIRESCSDYAVINDYIEPRQFLEDAGNVVLERVRDAVKKYGMKVNIAFNDKFATNNKRDIKSINTKNIEIY